VAIDEEGTNTLIRLAGLSLAIGMTLAYLSFGRIRVALMIFFVGGTAAISSLAIVWYGGNSMDAILMTMPSLVYVLALSASVHFVNYYRDACHEFGPRKAAELAVKYSWFPITLAAFTTALGLMSLTTSSLKPIYKFGLFSAIGVVTTVALLYAYLPSALTIWPPGYRRASKLTPQKQSGLVAVLNSLSQHVGNWVIRHYRFVIVLLVGLVFFLGLGLLEVKTTVQLLKLFDSDAKILKDYQWLEKYLGELVPAEIVVCVDKRVQKEAYAAQIKQQQLEAAKKNAPPDTPPEELASMEIEYDEHQLALRYSMLERVELSSRVRKQLEKYFGPEGLGVVGSGMSTDVFTPLYRLKSKYDPIQRFSFSAALEAKKNEMIEQDYLAIVGEGGTSQGKFNKQDRGREMWRISIRLAALNNVDYGQFVNELKQVIEPILNAYQYRTQILNAVHAEVSQRDQSRRAEPTKILILGRDPRLATASSSNNETPQADVAVNQSLIFAETLQDLLLNRGYERRNNARNRLIWLDPVKNDWNQPELSPEERQKRQASFSDDQFGDYLAGFQCVVLLEDHPLFKPDVLTENSKQLVDARNHRFEINPRTRQPLPGSVTMRDRKKAGEEVEVSAIYTGIVPIVYKAQRALLQSLIESIAISFLMISVVMMILLRRWGEPWRLNNLVNLRAGMFSMIPNVFPVLIVFGYMGWAGIEVDIGSMMTASVAMGIAVDDTIHFLTWYQHGLAQGLDRNAAIRYSYDRVAVAMIQTTLIAGLGLAAFALSTFTPTQRFGILMLCLLVTALVGDLLLLPALLVSPIGKFFDIHISQPPPSDDAESEDFSGDQLTTDAIRLRVIQDDSTPSNLSPEPRRKWH
jgi:predicted RND superfamily exporter protein